MNQHARLLWTVNMVSIFLLWIITGSFAADVAIGNDTAVTPDSIVNAGTKDSTVLLVNIPKVQQAINCMPISYFLGIPNLYYEILFGGKHGVALDASYTIPRKSRGFSLLAQYRHHFYTKPRHSGIRSPYWGVYGAYAEQKRFAPDSKRKGVEYPYSYKFISIGANIGNRWVIGKRFNISGRIGLGYPDVTMSWKNNKPEEYKMYEAIVKYSPILNSELSVGFVF